MANYKMGREKPGKRKMDEKPSKNKLKEAIVEDKETLDDKAVEDVDQNDSSGDEEDDDSSVYSELEGEEEEESDDEELGDEKSDEKSDEEGGEKDAKEAVKDEYEYDSSDEEDIRNTIGNIPINWYDEYDHLGYDLDGKKIRKPKRGDELDHFLSKMDDPNFGVTVRDPTTGQDVVLSEKDVETIKRLVGSKVPNGEYDLYENWVNWFSAEPLETPVRDLPEHKRSFTPSTSEKKLVGRMVHAIKMGWMKTRAQREAEKKKEGNNREFYMLWKTDDQPEDVNRIKDLIPAPKMRLPGHEESYNPPPEYLLNERETERWKSLEDEPYKRKTNFLPQKYDSLRKVPAYAKFISERFERCLDLYLAPRARKMRLTIQPEDLVPQLPQPKDLQPFPQVCALTYKGHKNMIRTLSMEQRGQFFASGSDDGTVKIWEVQTGYCHKTFTFGSNVVVQSVAWCPNGSLSLLAVAVENRVVLLNTGVGDKVVVEQTNELLDGESVENVNEEYVAPERVKAAVTWQTAEEGRKEANTNKILIPKEALVVLKVFKPVKQVTWHAKGDYFSTVCPEGLNRSVLIHQLSKRRSQIPFNKAKGLIQSVLFHPIKPFLFVATQRHVRIYNLAKQELSKKLMTGAKWISSIAIHPKGDNVLLGTFDKKVQWFDLDLSTSPYQVLRFHLNAVRSVAYHSRYPLFATSSDDNSIVVSHGMVYNDLLQNPLIVPVKFLKGHTNYDGFGVMNVAWHPTQPWLLSAGADGYIKLWT